MTARPTRQTASTDVALHPGTLRSGWCPECKAWTLITADLLLLSPDGLSTVGTGSWCEICDDADSPLPARRIDRG
ncbi:hypothetical protein EES44_24345 [Streptomyces sp. ADI96-15]|nr:hypothetical protein EES44_24345 [Streptomyces sp. ADI96-15]